MPQLDWIGKQAVVNHHREVPYRLLHCDEELSVGDPGSGNLLVEGDNLEALKALLPHYAGQVKLIYIDPPYNTGNEKWVYNDNVNAPEMRKWLRQVVGSEAEDLSRHDKWLCMMYPRLVLLRQFLREDGAIFISIDDNEVGHLRCIMDEVFGARNFVATFIWEKRTTRENRRVFSFNHDFILCAARSIQEFQDSRGTLPMSRETLRRYANPDNDPRGDWQSVSLAAQAGHGTPAQFYTMTTPAGRKLDPPPGNCWRVTEKRLAELLADNRIWYGPAGKNVPRLKVFLSEADGGLTPHTLWAAAEVGTTDTATKALNDIFGGEVVFGTPKPAALIKRILQIATGSDSLVLDSFAGSGTTGHAVLAQNADDGGNRRFILVELEPHIAQPVTRERLRRVIEGYSYQKPNGQEAEVAGLGGGFRYCRLGARMFDEAGRINPEVRFEDLARHIVFAETGEPLSGAAGPRNPLIAVRNGVAYYLLYNGVLRDKRANGGNVLTSAVLASLPPHGGLRVVYGTGCRLGADRLKREGVVFRQIPYQIKVD
jgi:site-specific DNA-methyltransferase (adenine-specific)/adenine-specific DNA-methyltransferase